ncbi:hypothetical protein FHS96_000090 [Sphingomonas zeicaulis]|uniref:hypothetical protein n=1 Tax=Sphingomonas zeicaulis TaxID=1632740 RepID=UPI003D1915B6
MTADPARAIVAELLRATGRAGDAALVEAGGAEDFPELVAARQVLGTVLARQQRLEAGLACYADDAFWDDGLPGGALAGHDRGEIARNVLAGRAIFAHRD